MVKLLLIASLLSLTACDKYDKNYMRQQAKTFCECNNSKVNYFFYNGNTWNVQCDNGTGIENANKEATYECSP